MKKWKIIKQMPKQHEPQAWSELSNARSTMIWKLFETNSSFHVK